MSESASAPVPAVKPAPGPATPAPVAREEAGEAPLTGEQLRAQIVAQLTGEPPDTIPDTPPAPTNGPLPGAEAAPPAALPGQPPASDDGKNNDDDHPDDATLPAGLRRTLHDLRAERRELRAELAEIKAALKNGPPGEDGAPPAAPPQPATPEQRVARLSAGLNWAKRTLAQVQTGDVDGALAQIRQVNAQPPSTDADSLATWLEGLREVYADELTDAKIDQKVGLRVAREEATMTRETARAKAIGVMPELAQPDSPRAKMAAQLRQAHPWLAQDPRSDMAIVALIRGVEALRSDGAAPANGNGSPAQPRVVLPAPRPGAGRLPGPGTRAVPGGSELDTKALFKRYEESGKPEDKAAWQAAVARDVRGTRAG
jgi:hypothetical protein